MSPFLLHEVKAKSEILTLNSPSKLNVLSEAMMTELIQALGKCEINEETHAVILRATGKAFCAGHDLKEMQKAREDEDNGLQYYKKLFERCSKLMNQIRNLSKPVIAEVQGVATAAGCQLVATCDIAVASSDAKFGVNGVNIGLFCSTPMVALSRNVGRKKVFEMLVTGDFLSAVEAMELGLVNYVVNKDDLSHKSEDIAAKISEKFRRVVKIGKQAFYKQLEMTTEEAYQYTANVMAENMVMAETIEGVNAFIQKKRPENAE